MKVFVCNSKDKFCENGQDYSWTEFGEILFLGLFRYDHHVGLMGIQTKKGTTHIVVKDLDITIDFLLELAREAYIKGGHAVTEDDKVALNLGFDKDLMLDYKKNLEDTLKEAEKFNVDDKIKVEGFEFYKL